MWTHALQGGSAVAPSVSKFRIVGAEENPQPTWTLPGNTGSGWPTHLPHRTLWVRVYSMSTIYTMCTEQSYTHTHTCMTVPRYSSHRKHRHTAYCCRLAGSSSHNPAPPTIGQIILSIQDSAPLITHHWPDYIICHIASPLAVWKDRH